MTRSDHHETKTSELGAAAAKCIEFGNNGSKNKICSSIAEARDVEACKLTPPTCSIPSGDCCAVSGEDGKGCLVTNGDCFPVACKSACSLTVNETDLSSCGTREGNTFSLGNDSSAEEKIVRDDVIVCGLSSATNGKNVYESHLSKCPQSTEGKVSGVENNGGSTEHKAEENSKLRARKRGKYLSPPFVELVKGEGSKESESPGDISIQDNVSPSLVKCRGKRKQSKKSVAGSANLEAITLSSAELLLQLRMIAHNYLNPYYDPAFGPTELFVNSFRASVFFCLRRSEMRTAEKARTDKGDAQKRNITPVKKTKKERSMAESDTKALSGSCNVNVNFTSSSPLAADPQMGCSPASSNIKPQGKRKMKVEPLANPGANEMAQIPDLNSNNGVLSAKLDPLQVTDHSGPKSEPVKKKRMRKKELVPLFTLSGFPYAYANSVKPMSSEECLLGSRLISFAASTGPNNANIASSTAFCAEVSTPRSLAPPAEPQPLKRVNAAVGFDTNKKSSSEMTFHAGLFSFVASTGLNLANVASSPDLCAKGFTPTPPAPPTEPQAMKGVCRLNTTIGFGTSNKSSSPGLRAKGFTPRPAATPHEPQSLKRANTAIGFYTSHKSSSPGLRATGFTPRPVAPPHEPQSMKRVNTAFGFETSNKSISPGLRANGSTSRPAAPPHEPMKRVNTPFGFETSHKSSSPGLFAKGSMPKPAAPSPQPQSMKRVNTPTSIDNNNKSGSEMTLDQMKQNLEFMTSMLEKSGNMISPAMRANLEKEIKNLLNKVNPMVNSSSS